MSDVTFNSAPANRAPANRAPAAGRFAWSLLRAGVHRGRTSAAFVADLHDTYNLIEAGVLIVAAGSSAVVTAMAFGAHF